MLLSRILFFYELRRASAPLCDHGFLDLRDNMQSTATSKRLKYAYTTKSTGIYRFLSII